MSAASDPVDKPSSTGAGMVAVAGMSSKGNKEIFRVTEQGYMFNKKPESKMHQMLMNSLLTLNPQNDDHYDMEPS